jgi:hypothetical protein
MPALILCEYCHVRCAPNGGFVADATTVLCGPCHAKGMDAFMAPFSAARAASNAAAHAALAFADELYPELHHPGFPTVAQLLSALTSPPPVPPAPTPRLEWTPLPSGPPDYPTHYFARLGEVLRLDTNGIGEGKVEWTVKIGKATLSGVAEEESTARITAEVAAYTYLRQLLAQWPAPARPVTL